MNKITNASRFLFEELVSRIQERSNAVGIAVAIVDRNGNTQYEKFFDIGIRRENCRSMRIRSSG